MKTTTYLSFLFLLFICFANAQNWNTFNTFAGLYYGEKISIGVKGGVIYANDLVVDIYPESEMQYKILALYFTPTIKFKITSR